MGENRKRILEVIVMKKMLKNVAMFLAIAAVVFAAGCAGNTQTTVNNSTGAQAQVTSQTPVSSEGANQTQVEPNVQANTNVTENNITTVNETSGNTTENNTTNVNTTEGNTTHVSSETLKLQKIRTNLAETGATTTSTNNTSY